MNGNTLAVFKKKVTSNAPEIDKERDVNVKRKL
jgi:hypothetical protein